MGNMLTMSRLYKNKKIVALLFCLIAVYTGMLVTDSVSEREPAALTFKYLGDIFCLLIVLASWRHAYSKADITLLLTGFFFVLGDVYKRQALGTTPLLVRSLPGLALLLLSASLSALISPRRFLLPARVSLPL